MHAFCVRKKARPFGPPLNLVLGAMFTFPDEVIRRMAERQFELGANRPNSWGLAAQRLLITADLLAPHIKEAEKRWTEWALAEPPSHEPSAVPDEAVYDMHVASSLSVWMMLVALAFENLIKGIFVSKQASPRGDGKLTAAGHDLVNLAKSAGLTLSQTEQRLLFTLSEYAVWKGRYSVPETSNDLYQAERRQAKKSKPPIRLGHIDNATKSCARMRTRLIEEFESAREEWSPS